MKKKTYDIYIEGFSRGNPGPAGIGIIIKDFSGNVVARISESAGYATIEQARFKAFMRALEEIHNRKLQPAHIHSSSEVLVRQIQGIYKVMDPVLKQLKKTIKKDFSNLKFKVNLVSFIENKESSALAEEILDKHPGLPEFESMPIRMVSTVLEPEEVEKAAVDVQRSAGGVLFKRDGGKFKVCLIAKKDKTIWALPKGRVDEGETPEQTAIREVLEETGNLAEVQTKLDEIQYYFYWKENNTFYHKFVYFFLMPLKQENIRKRDTEADAVLWLTPGEAYKWATYINEKEVIRKAKKIFDAMMG